jgi:hypothetical protein
MGQQPRGRNPPVDKADKKLYKPGTEPEIVQVPAMAFFEISGAGRPDSRIFSEHIGVLYSLAYAVRMSPKNGLALPGYHEFTVYPLEGIWDLSEAGKKDVNPEGFGVLDKSQLVYRLMIRQPSFVDEQVLPAIVEHAKRKMPGPWLDQVRLTRLEEGLCVQMTHIGPYDSEPASFDRMQAFCAKNGLHRRDHTHREIYMSDPRKTSPDALRTVLRWMVG